MNYTRQVTDLDTGAKSWLDLGDHRPLTEVAKDLGVGSQTFRKALLQMGLLQREFDERSKQHRNRLTAGAVDSGFGVRHDNKGFQQDLDCTPFDVLSPSGVAYVRDYLPMALVEIGRLPAGVANALETLRAFEAKRKVGSMTPEMRVCWLADHHPDLGPADVAAGVGVSETLVHRYRARQIDQRRALEAGSPCGAKWLPPGEDASNVWSIT
jgi:hypothetical protein